MTGWFAREGEAHLAMGQLAASSSGMSLKQIQNTIEGHIETLLFNSVENTISLYWKLAPFVISGKRWADAHLTDLPLRAVLWLCFINLL